MRTRVLTKVSFTAAATMFTACQGGDPGNESDGNEGPTSDRTYYEHVAPIVADNCYRCHREGGTGPFELKTYEQVKDNAALVAYITQERIMPPWLADNSGQCQTFQHATWLSEEQIQTIQDWVDADMPEGDPSNMPRFTVPNDHLVDVTHELVMSAPYVPNIAVDDDDYRCFIIDPEIDEEMYLTSYEVIPGNPHHVHHVLIYQPVSEADVQTARDLDAAEDGEGYTCFGAAGENVNITLAAAWAPGRMMWSYPEGTGVPIKPGIAQIMQIHYHVKGDAVPDQSSMALKLLPTVDKQLLPWFYANTQLALPPGKESAVTEFELSPAVFMDAAGTPQFAKPMTLYGIGPHMHQLGVSERIDLTKADGSRTDCLIDVPRWDFNWQFGYFFDTPIRVEPNDLIKMTCTYDTRSVDKSTYWGEGTDEEMCLALMFSVFDDGKIPTQ